MLIRTCLTSTPHLRCWQRRHFAAFATTLAVLLLAWWRLHSPPLQQRLAGINRRPDELLLAATVGSVQSNRPSPASSAARAPGTAAPGAAAAVGAAARPATLFVRFGGPRGRMGNRMFQYASGIGLAMRYGADARLVVDRPDVARSLASLRRVFSLSPLPEQPAAPSAESDVVTLGESGWGRYDADRFDNHSTFKRHNTTVLGYLQSWRYFEPVADRIRREFALTPHADAVAEEFLRRTGAAERGQVIVGLHVRRGDMARQTVKYTVGSHEYILKAVDYYLAKYGDGGGDDGGSDGGTQRRGLTLVVATTDRQWVEASVVPHLPANVTVVFTGLSAEDDMAVLSRCNHSIITGGTFGWWSAWLASGDVVYYKNFMQPSSLLYNGYLQADHFPPGWLGLD